MISLLITATIMFLAIKLMHKDKDVVDFGLVVMLVLVPGLVMFLINLAIGIMGLNQLVSILGLVAGVLIVFFISKNAFDWSKTKSASLASIYFVAIIGSEVVMLSMLA